VKERKEREEDVRQSSREARVGNVIFVEKLRERFSAALPVRQTHNGEASVWGWVGLARRWKGRKKRTYRRENAKIDVQGFQPDEIVEERHNVDQRRVTTQRATLEEAMALRTGQCGEVFVEKRVRSGREPLVPLLWSWMSACESVEVADGSLVERVQAKTACESDVERSQERMNREERKKATNESFEGVLWLPSTPHSLKYSMLAPSTLPELPQCWQTDQQEPPSKQRRGRRKAAGACCAGPVDCLWVLHIVA
jgi:hypothetical protein